MATTCPILQMSYGDITRYLQSGYDAPVQRAMESHVLYCNACQEALDEVRALRRTGQSRLFMTDEMPDEVDLDEATLAAFVGGTLDASDERRVATSIGSSFAAYQRYAAVEQELSTPVADRFHAPERAREAVRVPEPQRVALRERMTTWLQGLQLPRWALSASSLAVGTLLIAMLMPALTAPRDVSLPALEVTRGDHQTFSDRGIAAPVPAVRVDADTRTFTWPATPGAVSYQAFAFDASGEVVHVETVDAARWTIDPVHFATDAWVAVQVLAQYENGGLGPITDRVPVTYEN